MSTGEKKVDPMKEAAGERAVGYVKPGMALGLGTGSTTDYFLIALGRECRAGRLPGVRGVPTSERSAARARELGIPLTTLTETPVLDVAVDGADEISPVEGPSLSGGKAMGLIKGLGGALLREKIVVQAAKKFVVIADGSKVTGKLGTKPPVPVEVVQFEHGALVPFFRSLGAEPVLRLGKQMGLEGGAGDRPYVTDNGNFIYDLRFPSGIDDPAGLEIKLLKRAGVCQTGLFLGFASVAVIARPEGVEERLG
jgi:ribose 5-phosphate isomerase A